MKCTAGNGGPPACIYFLSAGLSEFIGSRRKGDSGD